MSGDTGDGTAAFVLGLDGVPWRLVERWASAGELPNFAATIDEGAAGPLASTTPATTPLAWPSIATGVRPDRHGIYAFRRLTRDYSHRMYTSADRRHPALWEFVEPSVVGNVPMTYPAHEVDGAMVAGMMSPTTGDGFTHPPALTDEIAARVPEYRVALDWSSYDGGTGAFAEEIEALVDARRAVMELLLERDWRLAFFVYTAPDRLQHIAWDEDVLLAHYRRLDAILGDVRERVAERDATLYVVSDHGFGPVSRFVRVNRLLETEGYLARQRPAGLRRALDRLGVTKERVLGLLDRLGVDKGALLSGLPRSVTEAVASQVPGDHELYDVAFGETEAFLHGPGNLYVNDGRRFADGPVPPEDLGALKEELAEFLSGVVDPETGERALSVHDGDDLFPTDDAAPDLVVEGRDGYETVTGLHEEAFADTGPKAAGHRSEGLFLAWGEHVDPGATVADASVLDVTPTVLHGLGESVPRTADGGVLRDVFAPGTAPARRAVTKLTDGRLSAADAAADRGPGDDDGDRGGGRDRGGGDAGPDEDFDEVEDRLRGLGYME